MVTVLHEACVLSHGYEGTRVAAMALTRNASDNFERAE
jgi:hypothetical protein